MRKNGKNVLMLAGKFCVWRIGKMKPIEIIYKKPREGKTTELIKRCAENGGVIVSANYMRARRTYEMAKSLGYEIPMPITHENLLDKYYCNGDMKKIYIDDAVELIQKIANGLEIKSITIDDLSDVINKND